MKNNLIILFASIFISFTNLYSQNELDSLLKEYKSLKIDKEKSDFLFTNIWKYLNLNNKISETLAFEAITFHTEKEKIGGVAEAYVLLSKIYTDNGNYTEAYKLLEQAIDLSLENNFEGQLALAYQQLGNLNFYIGNNEKTIEYNQKALDIFIKNNNKISIAGCYLNIANVYSNQGYFNNSLANYGKALKIYQELNDTISISRVYLNLAIVYFEKGDYKKQLEYNQKVLEIGKDKKNIRDVGLALINNSETFIILKRYKKAQNAIDSAFKISCFFDDKDWILNLYTLSSKLDSAQGNYLLALENYKKSVALKDSILNEKNISEINELQIKYMSEIKENENRLQKTEISKQRIFIILLSIALLLTTLIILGIIFWNKYRRDITQKMTIQENFIIQQEAEIKQNQIELYEAKLENAQKDLVSNALFLVQANEKNKKIIQELTELIENKKDGEKFPLKQIISKYQIKRKDDAWREFELRFKEVHIDFYKKLSLKHPNLTPTDRKLAAYLRLNLSSKEIAELTYTNVKSINVARSRLRIKLNLTREDNLVSYLITF